MSYAVTVEVVGDDGVLATYILDDHDDPQAALDHASAVCDQEFERTGIQPSLLDD